MSSTPVRGTASILVTRPVHRVVKMRASVLSGAGRDRSAVEASTRRNPSMGGSGAMIA
jgi:hypothetical protein